MATLMQKDVLLEMTFVINARIFYAENKINEEERMGDLLWVGTKKNMYYSTDENELNFYYELNELKSLKDKYDKLYV